MFYVYMVYQRALCVYICAVLKHYKSIILYFECPHNALKMWSLEITSIDALKVPFITDGVAHCDIIKLGQEFGLIQPELALGHPGL